MTHCCFNPSERYIVIWRGDHYGRYHWITPSSIKRLKRLLQSWQLNERRDSELFLSEVIG